MILVVFIITMICSVAAIAMSSYAIHLTSIVSGEKLLTIDSELGYRYATTYHTWQIAAVIAVVIAVILWVITICLFVKRSKKKRAEKINKAMS